MKRDLSKALELARDLCLMVCRCGHADSEHLLPGKCTAGKCRCRDFVAVPLRVELSKER